jgi:phosphate transport system ATP-binding protein
MFTAALAHKAALPWQEATRVSARTAFFYLGELIEYAPTETIFGNPSKRQTEDYVSGRFG